MTPADIPALETAAAARPTDATARFRLSAGLLAAGRCDSAVVVARAAAALAPQAPMGPLVIGACQEKEGRADLAYQTYRDFTTRYPRAYGAAALRGKAYVALRAHAALTARTALAGESALTRLAPEPATLAVLPVTIAGDSALAPLSRGLAELITSDLALVRSLRLLERVQVGALLDEMKLGADARADPATAARVGRLLRAERLVQGVAALEEDGPVRMSAAVVRGDGAVRSGAQVTGVFRNLLDLEKQLVLGLAIELGIQLTEAERQRILRQGPKNLAAFLAYSEGLAALDRGDYRAAAAAFGSAARADPTFQAAQQQRQAAEAAPVVEQAAAAEIVTVVEAVETARVPEERLLGEALGAAGRETSPVPQDARSADIGGPATASDPTTESRGITSFASVSVLIRIIFRLP